MTTDGCRLKVLAPWMMFLHPVRSFLGEDRERDGENAAPYSTLMKKTNAKTKATKRFIFDSLNVTEIDSLIFLREKLIFRGKNFSSFGKRAT
jgi:hypothetical protein